MIKLNIHEAKTHLSRYLDELAKGETILLCKRNIPVAEIKALPHTSTEKRPLGLARGEFSLTDAFFEPLPDAILSGFLGKET